MCSHDNYNNRKKARNVIIENKIYENNINVCEKNWIYNDIDIKNYCKI